ncbi:peroxiredoxin hyr1 [Coelomomyces lativittatus]|nr:peroxiredoxin hyr1 [Coelomomyces lativittatus]KAJ1505765.1 peroxiredoxin hyr1 [Coelomomyces lativittatus]KAJ1514031.1 peroxiredoxin hyr1 [Coelomomyces lativittatus]
MKFKTPPYRNFHRCCCSFLLLHFIFTLGLASYLLLKHTFKLSSFNPTTHSPPSPIPSSSSSSSSSFTSFLPPSYPPASVKTMPEDSSPGSFYALSAKDARHQDFPFSQLKNKVVLIVNVASKCGFTNQYKGLEALYNEYKDRNFIILGFPCNQFAHQEPGTEEEILQFCSLNYNVTFPIMEKVDVNDKNTHPVYAFLKNQKKGILGIPVIKWNFEKFLIGKHGNVIERYSSLTKPENLRKDIENALAVPSS